MHYRVSRHAHFVEATTTIEIIVSIIVSIIIIIIIIIITYLYKIEPCPKIQFTVFRAQLLTNLNIFSHFGTNQPDTLFFTKKNKKLPPVLTYH